LLGYHQGLHIDAANAARDVFQGFLEHSYETLLHYKQRGMGADQDGTAFLPWVAAQGKRETIIKMFSDYMPAMLNKEEFNIQDGHHKNAGNSAVFWFENEFFKRRWSKLYKKPKFEKAAFLERIHRLQTLHILNNKPDDFYTLFTAFLYARFSGLQYARNYVADHPWKKTAVSGQPGSIKFQLYLVHDQCFYNCVRKSMDDVVSDLQL
jgi:hypothetical protein